MTADYDEALFWQRLKRRVRFNTVTRADLEAVFWEVSPEIEEAIRQQKGEEALEGARIFVRDAIVPELARKVEAEGMRVVD